MAPETTLELLLRLLAATLTGAVVGLNREITHKPAGLRTHALVGLGAATVILITVQFIFSTNAADPGEVTRAIQGVITGIGFVGGGVILRIPRDQTVHGLTTAATIWVTAALGMACALGMWAPALGGLVLGLLVLTAGNRVEALVHRVFKTGGEADGAFRSAQRRRDEKDDT